MDSIKLFLHFLCFQSGEMQMIAFAGAIRIFKAWGKCTFCPRWNMNWDKRWMAVYPGNQLESSVGAEMGRLWSECCCCSAAKQHKELELLLWLLSLDFLFYFGAFPFCCHLYVLVGCQEEVIFTAHCKRLQTEAGTQNVNLAAHQPVSDRQPCFNPPPQRFWSLSPAPGGPSALKQRWWGEKTDGKLGWRENHWPS